VKFLADMGISQKTVEALREWGYEAKHLRELGMMRAPDIEIVQKARSEGRTILTCDLDFGEILALSQLPLPSIIIFRLSDYRPLVLNPLLMQVLLECEDTINRGALIVIEDHRYRIRRFPISLD